MGVCVMQVNKKNWINFINNYGGGDNDDVINDDDSTNFITFLSVFQFP